METKTYDISGFRVKTFEIPEVLDGITYKYYITVNPVEDIKVRFTSLADARKWCKHNYLWGVYKNLVKV